METDFAKIVAEMLTSGDVGKVFKLGDGKRELAVEVRLMWIREIATNKTNVLDNRFVRDPEEVMH